MNNAQIAMVFDEIADLLEIQDANPFRVRAYRNGARAVRDLTEPVVGILDDEDRKLTDLPGIGKDLAEKISTLCQTGSLPMHQELLTQIPVSVLTLMRVPGVGPKKAAALHRELGISSLEELREACTTNRVQKLKGFGAKTEQTILAGLEHADSRQQRLLWAEADQFVQSLLDHLRSCPSVQQIEAAGSYRRGRDTVADLDLLVVSNQVDEVMDRLAAFDAVETILARGETKMSVRLAGGLQVDLRVVPAESFGAALQYFTGSKEHNVVLRGLAKGRGLKINEYGVFRGDEYLAGRTEEDVYATLDLPCFPPELREARREFEWANADGLPKLVEADDVLGDLHMHTDATDGKATLREMVEAARERGLKYIAITDHSKRVSMANGLDADRLREQWSEIDRLNRRVKGIKVLKGVEVDILEKGGLDLDDDLLSEADWVVASLHYGQQQPREQITRRILEALANPTVCAIGHPTGRLINRRQAYEVDLDAVFKAARKHGKFLELNANPQRLDLDDVACAAAKEHGVPIVISTDAHSVEGLDKLRYGILQARRGGLTKADVVNTRPWSEVKKLLGR
ncbi:MAG TPA: DNA polymerase/3'-5' exonuclease PolX [Pirellulales bacterium]|jgi:DNA polymerase (family 10)|nr:DNA polymerase/3'-5' exonuclease PolX [Pirellulales bacterium]